MLNKIYNIFHAILVNTILIVVLAGTCTIFYKSYGALNDFKQLKSKVEITLAKAEQSVDNLGQAAHMATYTLGTPEQAEKLGKNLREVLETTHTLMAGLNPEQTEKLIVDLGKVTENLKVMTTSVNGNLKSGRSVWEIIRKPWISFPEPAEPPLSMASSDASSSPEIIDADDMLISGFHPSASPEPFPIVSTPKSRSFIPFFNRKKTVTGEIATATLRKEKSFSSSRESIRESTETSPPAAKQDAVYPMISSANIGASFPPIQREPGFIANRPQPLDNPTHTPTQTKTYSKSNPCSPTNPGNP